MKMSNINHMAWAAVCMMCLLSMSIYATEKPEKEFEKKIIQEFDISSDAIITLDSKHGDVRVMPGDANKAYFEITIMTDVADQETADQVFSGIIIDFDAKRSGISMETEIDMNGKSSGSWFSKLLGGWNDDINFQIDIDVYLPNSVELDIEHAFGDVIIPEMHNQVRLELRHGNAKLADIHADAEIEIRHGKIKMQDVRDLDVESHHADVYVGHAQDVHIDISHSDFELDEAQVVEVDGSHSDFNLGIIHTLVSDGGFTDFDIEEVTMAEFDTHFGDIHIDLLIGDGEFELQHGEVEIKDVSPVASRLDFDVQHSSITLNVDQDFSIDYSGQHSKPRISHDMKVDIQDDSPNRYRYKGLHGKRNPTLRIIVEIQHGNFRMYE